MYRFCGSEGILPALAINLTPNSLPLSFFIVVNDA